VLVAVLAVIAGVVAARGPSGGAGTAGSDRSNAGEHARRPLGSGVRSRVVPARWRATLVDAPQEVLVDRWGAVAVGNRSATALALATGREAWHVAVDAPNPWAAADRRTVVLSTAGGFIALERDSGAVRWSVPTRETPGPVALAPVPAADPVAVVTTHEAGLVGLDAATGAVRWSLRLPGPVRGAPAVDAASGAVALVTGGAEPRLRVLDARTGVPRWDRAVAAQASTPVFADDVVVVGAGDGQRHSTVAAYASADGSVRWSAAVPASFQPGLVPAVADGDVYVLDQLDHVTRLDGRTGTRRWSRDLRGAALVGAPVVVGGAVLVADALRTVTTLDRVTGRVLVRRGATGVPVRVAAGGEGSGAVVVVAQRLVERDHVSAYSAGRVGAAAPGAARSRE
jgi:outer membrane protein assembly factor BamB